MVGRKLERKRRVLDSSASATRGLQQLGKQVCGEGPQLGLLERTIQKRRRLLCNISRRREEKATRRVSRHARASKIRESNRGLCQGRDQEVQWCVRQADYTCSQTECHLTGCPDPRHAGYVLELGLQFLGGFQSLYHSLKQLHPHYPRQMLDTGRQNASDTASQSPL